MRDLTPRSLCHTDLPDVIAALDPVLRGRGQCFRTGNAASHFIAIDAYVERRLRGLRITRAGDRVVAGQGRRWDRAFFEALGPGRLRGTIRSRGMAYATT